jgi:hypothetical protein
MTTTSLPPDGELQLGPIRLPPGRRIIPFEGTGEPAAWVTGRTVPRPGPVWSALSGLHAETGLVPILLADGEADEDFFFYSPSEATAVDRLDAAQWLAARWDEVMRDYGEQARFSSPPGGDSPLTRPFPGLAPPSGSRLSAAERDAALGPLPAARIGLVPAQRPADVLPAVGWSTFDVAGWRPGMADGDVTPNPVWIAAVLRSWEDRFGARLLNVGPGAEIRLLVGRPPRSLEAAQGIAAEHRVFADECAGCGANDIASISASMVNSPIWTFWWD